MAVKVFYGETESLYMNTDFKKAIEDFLNTECVDIASLQLENPNKTSLDALSLFYTVAPMKNKPLFSGAELLYGVVPVRENPFDFYDTRNNEKINNQSIQNVLLNMLYLLNSEDCFPKEKSVIVEFFASHGRTVYLAASTINAASHDANIVVITDNPRVLDEMSKYTSDFYRVSYGKYDEKSEKYKHEITKIDINDDALQMWLDDYSIGELFSKNVI